MSQWGYIQYVQAGWKTLVKWGRKAGSRCSVKYIEPVFCVMDLGQQLGTSTPHPVLLDIPHVPDPTRIFNRRGGP